MLSLAKSLSRLISLREEKRATLQRLFDERKRIDDQRTKLNAELMQLDDDIDQLEEQQLHHQSHASVIKQEEPIIMASSDSLAQQSLLTTPPLTMKPDEILSETTQDHQGKEEEKQKAGELSTHPETQTEEENSTFRTEEEQPPSSESKSASRSSLQQPRDVRPVHPKQSAKRKKNSTAGPMDEYVVSNNNNTSADNDWEPDNDTGNSALASGLAVAATRRVTLGSSSPYCNHLTTTVTRHSPYSEHVIKQTLRQSFRLESFRENQMEIIQTTLSGKDCFVLMKTGGGKSLLYQLPAVLESPKITLVISPLVSLIQDQEKQMNHFVPHSCVSFTSGIGAAQHTANWNRVRDVTGGVTMILVTPEKVFKSNKLKAELQKLEEQNRLGRFVIDECHCACQWGHDFRPDYAKISVLRTHFPNVPILAVTATASDQVREDCANIFQLSRDYVYFRSTADRPNLKYQVRPKESANDVIMDMVTFIKEKHRKSAGIVYTYSRKDADTVAGQLCEEGIIAESYHSEVNATTRRNIHESWMRNDVQVVVATIAFGLGINKPDVRFVFHHTLSKTLEAYYQESGRAGRDGKESDCVLYYSAKDVPRMIRMINGDANADLFVTMVKYAQQFGDDKACRALILRNMGEPNLRLEECKGLNDMVEVRDVTSHAVTVLQLLHLHRTENMTMPMLIKEWRQNPTLAPECVRNNPPGKELTPSDCERIIVGLLVNKLIKPNCRYTAYDTVVYLENTEMASSFITSTKARMRLPLPKKILKTASKRKSSGGGWMETQRTKTKRTMKKTVPSKMKKTVPSKMQSASKHKIRSSKSKPKSDVIVLLDESDDDGCSTTAGYERNVSTQKTASSRNTIENPLGRETVEDVDEDTEFEFEG